SPRGRSRRGDLRGDDQAGRGDPRRRQPTLPRPRCCPVRGGGRGAVRGAATGRGRVSQVWPGCRIEDSPLGLASGDDLEVARVTLLWDELRVRRPTTAAAPPGA